MCEFYTIQISGLEKVSFMSDNSYSDTNIRYKVDPFAIFQLFWYVLSSICMIIYSQHYLLSIIFPLTFPLHHRVTFHASSEVIILIGRFINEYYYNRYGTGDVLHHLSLFFGTYLVFTQPDCIPYGWYVCQMNVLHFPMMLWYLGCKRGSISSHKPLTDFCKIYFPLTWIQATSYRTALSLLTCTRAFATSNYTVGIVAFVVGCMMFYLDYGWTRYFLTTLEYPTEKRFFRLTQNYICGFTIGAVVAGIL